MQRREGMEVQRAIRTFIWLFISIPAAGFVLLLVPLKIEATRGGLLPYGVTGPWLLTLIFLAITWYVASVVSGMIFILPEWSRAIVFRMGRYERVAGPGLFFVLPYIWSVPAIIPMWTRTKTITAAQTLTKDNIPVDVEAVLFFCAGFNQSTTNGH